MKKELITKLADSLLDANKVALEAFQDNDGGSSNLDSCVIKLLRWKEEEVKEVSELSGVSLSDKLSGFWSGYRFVGVTMMGQGFCRTKMAEAAYKSLKSEGYDVCMYYSMD